MSDSDPRESVDRESGLERVAEVFEHARELEGEERDAYLSDTCAGDSALRAEVESLIEAHGEQGEFLAQTVSKATPLLEGPGTVIGNYKLLQLIGEGGFGAVYMAEQREPVKRKVALKIIKVGMDTKQVVARFEAERQALAMMDHPNIAKVLDAGATETGRPYFVMELVKGVPITEYCNTENLDTTERLELFTHVCKAVQHAHHKGIIHRDIKPSNVMVTLHDDTPVPKVIDFGIAKAMNRELTDKTLFTEYRQFIGTPEYMSPEQAEMSGLDVDTRCDVYSLGVLLYELLTGTTPFDPARLRRAALDELQRIIREEEPQKPSTRLDTMSRASSAANLRDTVDLDSAEAVSATLRTVTAGEVARHRRTDVVSLTRQLRGDLDWIVLKCLEKDRTRRYSTANELAREIHAHLQHEPVIASPPSAGYRFRKFVRRNKVAFASAAVVVVALVLGLAVATVGFVHASNAEARTAEEAKGTRAVAEFFERMFENVNPLSGGPAAVPFTELTVEELLNRSEPLIAGAFEGKPLLEADVRETFGRGYASTGGFAKSESQYVQVLELRREHLGETHRDTLRALSGLGYAKTRVGATDGLAINREAYELGVAALGADDPDVISMQVRLGFFLIISSREEVDPLVEDVLERAQRVLGPDHKEAIWARALRGMALLRSGRGAEAVALNEENVERARRTQPQHAQVTVFSLLQLAHSRMTQARFDDAEAAFLEAHDGYLHSFGRTHPWLDHIRCLHAAIHYERGDLEGARTMLEEILAAQRSKLGETDPDLFRTKIMSIPSLIELGRLDEAEELAKLVRRPVFLGWIELERGRLAEAEKQLRTAHENDFPGRSMVAPEASWLLGRCLLELRRFDEAEPLLLAAHARLQPLRGDDHRFTKRAVASLAELYERWGKPEEAKQWRPRD